MADALVALRTALTSCSVGFRKPGLQDDRDSVQDGEETSGRGKKAER